MKKNLILKTLNYQNWFIGKIARLLKNGSIEGGHWALIAASVGTMFAALTSYSPVIVVIESSVGAAGASPIVISFLF